jgi:hypothetical protein
MTPKAGDLAFIRAPNDEWAKPTRVFSASNRRSATVFSVEYDHDRVPCVVISDPITHIRPNGNKSNKTFVRVMTRWGVGWIETKHLRTRFKAFNNDLDDDL